jgi:hypothetical protein
LTDIEYPAKGGTQENNEEDPVDSEVYEKDAVRQEERVTTKVD